MPLTKQQRRIDNWLLTPSQPRGSYQGDSNVIKKLKIKIKVTIPHMDMKLVVIQGIYIALSVIQSALQVNYTAVQRDLVE